MTFFDSSTPVPIGQDSPEVSVKAPKSAPLPPVVTGNAAQDADYIRVRAARESGCTRACGNQPDLPVCTKCFVNLHAGLWMPDEANGRFIFGYGVDWEKALTVCSRVNGWIKPAMTAQPVQQQQANAASNGQESPSVKAPEFSPEEKIKHQLDRMESLLNEIKAAVKVDADLIGGYSMPFIPPVLDDFDQALEDAKSQQEAAESAPELLTEEEINRIYQSVSRDVERKEYDRLINKVIALNNYAKGGGSWGK